MISLDRICSIVQLNKEAKKRIENEELSPEEIQKLKIIKYQLSPIELEILRQIINRCVYNNVEKAEIAEKQFMQLTQCMYPPRV